MFSPEFLLTSLIVILIPGTGVVYTISAGLFEGWRASLAAAAGCTLGILPHIAASVLGLSLVLHMSALIFDGLKLAGAIYLLYLAWAMWRDPSALASEPSSPTRSLRHIIIKAVALNLLNPKLTFFFFAFLPLFVAPNSPSPAAELWRLSAVFMGMSIIVFAAYGALASSARAYILRSPRIITWLRRSFAAAFAALAAQLALADR